MGIQLKKLPLMGVFLYSILSGQSLPIPPDHPNTRLFIQGLRENHFLSVYQELYSFDVKLLQQYSLLTKKSNSIFGTFSSLQIGGGLERMEMISIWGATTMENWSVLVEPIIVNNPFGQPILGTGYVRSSVSGRVRNAVLRYTKPNLTVELGRSPIQWGQSWDSSIIHSSLTPTYDHISVKATGGAFQLDVMSGQLGADTTVAGPRIKRLTGGHRLTWISPNNKWFIGFGEQVIYTGANRSLEMMYLNPFIPYFFSALEGDEYYDPKDNDNSIIFLTARTVIKSNVSVYGEFLLDDFQVDDKNHVDGLAFKLGADGGFKVGSLPVTWETEFTQIDSWAYIHYGQSTSWWNRGHAMGYLYGPDLQSVSLQGDVWLSKQLLLTAKYIWLHKGTNTLSTVREGPETEPGDTFPLESVVNHSLVDLSLGWWHNWGIFSAGYSNFPFANEIGFDGLDMPFSGGFYLQFQLVYQKKFNIK